MALKAEVIEKIAALITAAFGLIAALAWNEAIKAIVSKYLGTGSDIIGFLIYAVVVTILAVIVTIWIARVAERAKG